MKTFTRVRSIANALRILAVAWILSGVCCFFPEKWIDSFLAWFGVAQMPQALPMIYVLRGVGWVCVGMGIVIWIVATDVVRYRPIVIAIIALHLIAAPVFYWMGCHDWDALAVVHDGFRELPASGWYSSCILPLAHKEVAQHCTGANPDRPLNL
jgi:hypothetical protein